MDKETVVSVIIATLLSGLLTWGIMCVCTNYVETAQTNVGEVLEQSW